MRAAIFTEGSSTTSESTESYSKHFEGSFLSVNSLVDDLSPYCETDIHVLSETYGYVQGEDPVNPEKVNSEESVERFQDALLSNVAELDVVVLLFTTSIFEDVVTPSWEELVDMAKPDSIWCIGTSRSALNSVALEELQDEHPVLLYQRRGVARVGNEVREELIEHIRSRVDE